MTNEEIKSRTGSLLDALEYIRNETDPDEINRVLHNIETSITSLNARADADSNRGKPELWKELLHQVNLELWDGILNLDFKKITNACVQLTQLERSMQ